MRYAVTAVLAGAAVGLLSAATVVAVQDNRAAEVVSAPLQIPRGAAKPGFDIRRLNTENYGAFVPFYVTRTERLRTALQEDKVAPDTRVLVTQTAGGKLALLTDQMAYHHLAQGRERGKDWMATF